MRFSLAAMALAFAVILTACSDDNTNTNNAPNVANNSAPMCPAGQRYNVVLGRCQADTSGNNNNNNQPGDMSPVSDLGPVSDMQTTPGDMEQVTDMDVPDQRYTEPDQVVACGKGSIKGRACAPSGEPPAALRRRQPSPPRLRAQRRACLWRSGHHLWHRLRHRTALLAHADHRSQRRLRAGSGLHRQPRHHRRLRRLL